jgi:DNA-binding GntR family transcriptional regulator
MSQIELLKKIQYKSYKQINMEIGLISRRRSKPLNSLADKAFHFIEEKIVTLQLKPGSLISEVELSLEINIGRTPIREALQRLAHEGMVSILPRRGIIVSEVDIMNQLEIMDLRRVVDRMIAAKAAKRCTDGQRKRLKEIAKAIEITSKNGDVAGFMHLDGEFDQIMQMAGRNHFGTQISETLHAHCRRFWYINRAASDLKRSTKLHVRMIREIAKGNQYKACEASDALSDYIENFTRSTLDN